MAQLDLDVLFAIAEAEPVLGKVEMALRQSGKNGLADKVNKLQQDVGLEIDNEMTGAFSEPPPGSESARLRSAYMEVSAARLGVLSESHAQLGAGELKDSLAAVIKQLPAHATGAGSAPGTPAQGPSR